jgi:hypothetical protein
MQKSFVTIVLSVALTALAGPATAFADIGPAASLDRARTSDRHADREQRNDREEQTEHVTKTLRIGPDGTLDVQNISGDITVTRGGGAEVTLDILKTARARSVEDAREMLGLVSIDISERGGRAEVRTRYPNDEERRGRRRNINVNVTYRITAPVNAQIRAYSISGNVSVRDIRGEVSAESVSGNVTVANGGRTAAAKTVSGNVEVTGTELEGGLDASSVSGNVVMRRIKARRLTLGSVSGNVLLDDVDCGRLEAQAVSGNVDFTGRLAAGGRYEMTSHSGEIHVTISGDTGFELDANSFSGSVRSDLPITIQGRSGRRPRAMQGVYGDGSAVLDLTTFSGSIVISKR